MRAQIIKSIQVINRRSMSNIDLSRLKKEINTFYLNTVLRNVNIENEKVQEKRIFNSLNRLRRARSNYDNCLSIYKSAIELEDNNYLQNANKTLKIFNDFITLIGISSARLDVISDRLQELDKRRAIGENTNYPSITLIEDYRETLLTFMNNIIIFPLIETLKKYYSKSATKEEKGKKLEVIRDSDFFSWLLFREIYSALQIEGSIERQASFTGKYANIKKIDIPSKTFGFLPDGARYQEIEPEENKINISDPFLETIGEQYENN